MSYDPNDESDLLVLIVCVAGSQRSVCEILGRLCHAGWQSDGAIDLLVIPDHIRRIRPAVTKRIEAAAPVNSFVQVWIQQGIEIESRLRLNRDIRKIVYFPSLIRLEKDLPSILRPLSLDWLGRIARLLQNNWLHGDTVFDRNTLEKWLRQFEVAGNNRWVGEGLLKVLEFWPPHRQKAALGVTADVLDNYDRVCCNRFRTGKSGDFMASILRKQMSVLNAGYPPPIDLRDLMETKEECDCQSVLFIEDGLLTATETINYLSGLLGLPHPENRKWSTEPLTNPDQLRSKHVTMKFFVATQFGVARLRRFLSNNHLENVEVSAPTEIVIPNLTDAGIAALERGELFDGDRLLPRNADQNIAKVAFRDQTVWKDYAKTDRAIQFCHDVGAQLFGNYLRWKRWVWSQDRVGQCGLGMCGLGLALAYSHSVPRASLPLFWMDGDVTIGNRTVRWLPLFPDAKA